MRIAILFLCMTFSISLFSQDYLYRKDGTNIAVKDVLVNQNAISYTLYIDTNQYVQYISVIAIDSLVFQSGKVIKPDPSYQIDKRSLTKIDYAKSNLLYTDLFELLVFNNFNLGYEYMFKKAHVGLSLNLSRNFSPETLYHNPDKLEVYENVELGLKASINIYFLNTGKTYYGLRVLYSRLQYEEKIPNNDVYSIITSYSSTYGFGVFFRFRLLSFINPVIAIDAYDSKAGIYFLPQIALGFSF